MKAIYKLVNTSIRLPDKTGSYFVIVHGDNDLKLVMSWNKVIGDHQSVKEYMQDQAKDFKNNYQYWLEEESAYQERGKCYVECRPSEGEFVLRPVDPENTESVLNFVKKKTLPQISEIDVGSIADMVDDFRCGQSKYPTAYKLAIAIIDLLRKDEKK